MADISSITIPSGDSTATYNVKDSAALHGINDFSTATIVPITNLKDYQVQTLGASALSSNGSVTLVLGSVSNNVGTNSTTSKTDYKLSLAGVINSFTSTGENAASISGLTSQGQTVLTGIAAS